jgi:7-cyano-7-deazaguanine synthase
MHEDTTATVCATSAVLCSGGLDSAVLLAAAAREERVQPVYVSAGLAWETSERRALARLLEAPTFAGRVAPVACLEFSATDLYAAGHWALEGRPPAYDTPDEDVYLPGRNIMLLSKAAVFCAAHALARLAIGPLAGNPFPDATPAFFAAMARAVSLGLGHDLRIEAPFLALHKADVIRLGLQLEVPLETTLSCMAPSGLLHCGLCSKCRERRDAFADAGVSDPTVYQAASPRDRGRRAEDVNR